MNINNFIQVGNLTEEISVVDQNGIMSKKLVLSLTNQQATNFKAEQIMDKIFPALQLQKGDASHKQVIYIGGTRFSKDYYQQTPPGTYKKGFNYCPEDEIEALDDEDDSKVPDATRHHL